MLVDDRELTKQAARIEALLEEIDSFPDAAMRAKATEIVQGLLALYGEGLARMLAIIAQRCDAPVRARLLDAFAGDELISHLLLLHDLHPVDVQTRVARALEEVRPYLQSHGGNVELVSIDGGVARLRLQGSCHGCPSSTMTLKLAIEEAIQKAAPDLDGIEAEGVVDPPPRPAGFVPISTLQRPEREARHGACESTREARHGACESTRGARHGACEPEKAPAPADPAWTVLGALPQLVDGGMTALEVAGRLLLFAKLDGACYAYDNTCPGCGQSLDQGALQGAQLTCSTCGRQYDIRRAGRCLDAPDLTLEPLPLLMHDDTIKVACTPAVATS